MWCSVLECVVGCRSVECCSVLQCVAVWCSVLQCVAVCCIVLHCAVVQCVQSALVCCSVLQYVAAYCSVLHCVAVCCSVLQCCVLQCICTFMCIHTLHTRSHTRTHTYTQKRTQTNALKKTCAQRLITRFTTPVLCNDVQWITNGWVGLPKKIHTKKLQDLNLNTIVFIRNDFAHLQWCALRSKVCDQMRMDGPVCQILPKANLRDWNLNTEICTKNDFAVLQ